MTTAVVIPARWGSRRFPGKPLVPIAGRPLLARTVALARRALAGIEDTRLLVATDDRRVMAFAASLGCEVVMTPASLTTGTARVLAAAEGLAGDISHVVNMQGDSPFMPPSALSLVIEALVGGAAAATPVVPLTWDELDALRRHKVDAPSSGTTCIVDERGDAIWFSKQIIPAIRDEARLRSTSSWSPVLRHLGLYGFDAATLRRFHALTPSRYETIEGLEQLRLIEAGIRLRTCRVVERPKIAVGGIDTPDDVALAERLIAEHGDVPWA